MRVCIYGAGAIGGYLGAKLAATAADVSLVARGAHLDAIRTNGLRVVSEVEGEWTAHLRATDDPAELGPQDAVVIAVKAPAVPAIAEAMQPLLGPETAVVTAMNGIPWWYFHGHGGALEGTRLESVDPGGCLSQAMPPERCIGCVIYPAGEVAEPGVVRHAYGNRFNLGEPDGSSSERVRALSGLLADAGLKAPVRARIRDDIWVKLWGNLSFNPVSALTGATLEAIAEDPGTRGVVRGMMVEAQAIAGALDVKLPVDVDTRIGWARDVGAHKTSMLQDLERGKTMEIDALVTAVAEMGDLLGVETPMIDAVLALVIQRARLAGCY